MPFNLKFSQKIYALNSPQRPRELFTFNLWRKREDQVANWFYKKSLCKGNLVVIAYQRNNSKQLGHQSGKLHHPWGLLLLRSFTAWNQRFELMVCPQSHQGGLVCAEHNCKLVSYVLSVDLLIGDYFHCGFSFCKDEFHTVWQHCITNWVIIFCASVRV